MIKKLHMLATLFLGVAVSISAQAPKPVWAAVQDAAGTVNEIGITIEETSDNNVVTLSNYASFEKQATNDYWFLDMANGNKTSEKVYNGAKEGITMTSGNYNVVVNKIDAKTGHLLWSVESNLGEFSSLEQHVAATPDNGVVLFLKARHTNMGGVSEDILCQFVDKDGVATPVKWQIPGDKFGYSYQPVLVKISAEGKIEWAKHFEAGYKKVGEKKLNDAFSAGGVTVDKEGNIYLAGRFALSVNFGEKANFTASRNAVNWDGDTQGSANRGDMFVAKLDAKGNAVWGVQTTGDVIQYETIKDIKEVDGKLYMNGIVRGAGTIKMGDVQLKTTDVNDLFAVCLNAADGSAVWGKVFNVVANATCSKPVVHAVMNVSVHGDHLYLSGSFKGDLKDGEKVVVSSDVNQYNPYIIQCNAKDGESLNGLHITAKNGQAHQVYEVGEKIYATGYDLNAGASYIHEMDNQLSKESLQSHITRNCPFATSQASAMVGNIIVSVTAGMKDFTIPGCDWTYTPEKKFCLFVAHEIKGEASGIEAVESANEGAQVIYDLSGRRVAKATKGLYIINGKKVFVK